MPKTHFINVCGYGHWRPNITREVHETTQNVPPDDSQIGAAQQIRFPGPSRDAVARERE